MNAIDDEDDDGETDSLVMPDIRASVTLNRTNITSIDHQDRGRRFNPNAEHDPYEEGSFSLDAGFVLSRLAEEMAAAKTLAEVKEVRGKEYGFKFQHVPKSNENTRLCKWAIFNNELNVVVCFSHAGWEPGAMRKGATKRYTLDAGAGAGCMRKCSPCCGKASACKSATKAYVSIRAQLIETVEKVIKYQARLTPSFNLYIAGHGMGGAVASVAAVDFSKTFDQYKPNGMRGPQLYTFGAKKVANEHFAQEADKWLDDAYHVVSLSDLLPHLPTSLVQFGTTVVLGELQDKSINTDEEVEDEEVVISLRTGAGLQPVPAEIVKSGARMTHEEMKGEYCDMYSDLLREVWSQGFGGSSTL